MSKEILFAASEVHHSSGVAGSWVGVCGGDSGGGVEVDEIWVGL